VPEFLLPDLGEGLETAAVLDWRVEVGDRVEVDQVVVEVETAKAAVEVPVPFAGVVTVLHARPGETLDVGAPLITVANDRDVQAGSAEPDVVMPDPPVAPEEEAAGSGNVLIGYGTSDGVGRRRARRHRSAAADAGDGQRGRVAVISPLVRQLARREALDLSTVAGSGRAGLILRRDVESALRSRQDAPTVEGTVRRIPLTGLRRVAADKLSRSRREIPEATVWVDVDATELLSTRAELNRRAPERPVGVLALVAKFVLIGLRRYPELNARVEADAIVVPAGVNLGFAAQTDRGLVVPVLRDADRLSTRDLSAELARMTARVRAGEAGPAELSGGTFTVNNYGVFGVDGSAAIINHPEVAILGLGRIIDRPWVVDGELAVRKVSQLTLAFDHRVCDGGVAGGFLRFVADCVEAPATALGEV